LAALESYQGLMQIDRCKTPLNPPLSGGKWTNKRFSHTLRRLCAIALFSQYEEVSEEKVRCGTHPGICPAQRKIFPE
jgi:hypothetical protein